MNTQKKTIIRVPHSGLKKLLQLTGTTYPTARKALRGYTGNDLAKKIRHTAMELGGQEYKPV